MIGTFTPSIPQIAKDLSSTGAIVKWTIFPRPSSKEGLTPVLSIAVSMSILASSFGALTAGSYSSFCKFEAMARDNGFRIVSWLSNICLRGATCLVDGRRPTYLYLSLVFVIGPAGLAAAQSIPSLLFWRFIQAMGGSLGPSIAAAVIGDIYKLEERGGALGICFAASKLLFHGSWDVSIWFSSDLDWPVWINPHAFPCRYLFFFAYNVRSTKTSLYGCPGWITHSYSWRVVHVVLGLLGLIVLITIYFFFPETIHPGTTGIDKMKAANGIDSSTSFIFKFINPLDSLWLLRTPSLLLTVRLYAIR